MPWFLSSSGRRVAAMEPGDNASASAALTDEVGLPRSGATVPSPRYRPVSLCVPGTYACPVPDVNRNLERFSFLDDRRSAGVRSPSIRTGLSTGLLSGGTFRDKPTIDGLRPHRNPAGRGNMRRAG